MKMKNSYSIYHDCVLKQIHYIEGIIAVVFYCSDMRCYRARSLYFRISSKHLYILILDILKTAMEV
jgi:hypothetical protein